MANNMCYKMNDHEVVIHVKVLRCGYLKILFEIVTCFAHLGL